MILDKNMLDYFVYFLSESTGLKCGNCSLSDFLVGKSSDDKIRL